jgi:hypothetical protein
MTYSDEVIADSPALYLKMDETSGTTATDSSGNSRNGTHNNVTLNQASLLGDGSGKSASYNGTTAYTSVVDASWMNSSSFTVEARIIWDGSSAQFIGGRWGSSSHRPWLFDTNASGKLLGALDGSGTLVTGATTLSSTVASTVALRANGSTLEVWLNGVVDGSVSHAGPTQTGAPLEIARAALAAFSTLRIDEFSFYTTALSDARLAAHHAAAIGQSGTVAMTSTATLTTAGIPERFAAVAMSVVATLVAGGVREQPGVASLSSVATLTANGVREQPATTSLATTATLTSDAVVSNATADLATVSTLTAGGVRERPASASLVTVATLVSGAVRERPAAVSLVAVATLTPTADVTHIGIVGTTTVITVSVDSGDTPTFETMELVIADPTQRRAPTSVQVILNGADPGESVDFTVGTHTTVVWTLEADSNGSIFLGSVDIPGDIDGDSINAGTHTLHATGVTSGKVASDTFTLAWGPSAYPIVQSPDVDPVEISGRGNRWALQDPMPGGLGSWIMVPSPSSMSEPHLSKLVTVDHSTNPMDGRYHIEVADIGVKQWSFSGFCPDQAFYETLASYAELNRRFYVIDHRGRAWKVTFTQFDPTLRKRLINDDGTPQDWAADYTVTATIYDTDPVEPVTL